MMPLWQSVIRVLCAESDALLEAVEVEEGNTGWVPGSRTVHVMASALARLALNSKKS